MNKIKVNVIGETNVGKSTVIQIIRKALEVYGITVKNIVDEDPVTEDEMLLCLESVSRKSVVEIQEIFVNKRQLTSNE